MKNFEFYKDEIKALDYDFAVEEKSGEVIPCGGVNCFECLFHSEDGECANDIIKWLYEEHIEKPKLTPTERKLCEILQYKYIARDCEGGLWAFENRPCKDKEEGVWENTNFCSWVDCHMFNCNFSFIKWENDEAWAVEELLKLEVAE